MQSLNSKITGGTLTAAEWNEVPSELQNVIEGLGITLSGSDLNQLGKAVSGYVANGTFYTDSGAADAYVLTTIGLKQSLTAYTDGATFEFVAGNDNTGASTVNVSGLGVKNIKLSDGTDPAAGEISGRTVLKFDAGNDRCELQLFGSSKLIIISATGTYNPSPGAKSLEFIATGGGGGGGGIDGQGAGTTALSISGAGGATAIKNTQIVEASYTIVIGAGGTGGVAGNNNGTAGGNTTVTSTNVNLTANGGALGAGDIGTAGSQNTLGANGGTATGGDVNLSGGDSDNSTIVTGDAGNMSHSGGSFWGTGHRGRVPTAGFDAVTPGVGGGATGETDAATNVEGGDGADGILIIRESF